MTTLTDEEQHLAEGLAALHGEAGEEVLPSYIQDLLLASEVAVRSLAESRAREGELVAALERRVRPFLKRLIEATKPYHRKEGVSNAAEVLFDIHEDAVMFRALAQVEEAEPEGVLE